MIFLAHLTNRIPIIGPFAPTHVGNDNEAGFIPFGDVFDVPRLAKALHIPVLEWRDVKKPASPDATPETLGGWSAWSRWDTLRSGLPRGNHVVANLSLGSSDFNLLFLRKSGYITDDMILHFILYRI